jgi:protein phosphatase
VKIIIPELSLLVLIGPSGCGKSTFARQHFKPTEVLSSDFCRALVSDDENDQSATNDAFAVLHFIARKRLAAGRLTVVDATSVQPESRKPLVELAREFHVLPVAIVFDLPEKVCHERHQTRADRQFGPHVVRNQSAQLRRSIRGLEREGFRHIFKLTTPEEIAAVSITRQPLWNNLKHEHGPFDIIGDVHGCLDELAQLLALLGYQQNAAGVFQPPDGRKAIFVGDLVDRGPKTPETVRLVKDMVDAGYALCVPGNHDIKFMRAIWGKNVQITHGLDESLRQFKEYDTGYHGFSRIAADFINKLISHYVLDDGKLVVAHAGMKEEMQGRGSGKVRDFALYGETTGETDEPDDKLVNGGAEIRDHPLFLLSRCAEVNVVLMRAEVAFLYQFGDGDFCIHRPTQFLVSLPFERGNIVWWCSGQSNNGRAFELLSERGQDSPPFSS